MKKLLLFIITIINLFYSTGQQYSSSSKKAIKLLKEAMDAPRLNKDEFGRENYKIGLEIAQKSFEKDHVDKFLIESLDLGTIKKVHIEHDNTSFKKVKNLIFLIIFIQKYK